LRFLDRLTVQWDIAENSLKKQIPPAVILALAENAVKHGVSKTIKECRICVNSFLQDDFLVIRVTNYCLLDIGNAKGIGLRHIVNRLDEIYNNKASFKLEKKGDFVHATIQIPI
jgi:two-component system LytT family sensor kinase